MKVATTSQRKYFTVCDAETMTIKGAYNNYFKHNYYKVLRLVTGIYFPCSELLGLLSEGAISNHLPNRVIKHSGNANILSLPQTPKLTKAINWWGNIRKQINSAPYLTKADKTCEGENPRSSLYKIFTMIDVTSDDRINFRRCLHTHTLLWYIGLFAHRCKPLQDSNHAKNPPLAVL